MFSGPIPTFIQNLTELTVLSLAANRFHSEIPSSFWGLLTLERLDLSQNLLNGSIPTEIGNLKVIYILDLASNLFMNTIPNSLGYCQSLIGLNVSNNVFKGLIPESFGKLIVLESLDLSSNFLSGTIPKSLELLQDLNYLNLSFNQLEGEIPHGGVFANLTYRSLMGNPQLCGTTKLNLPLCPSVAKQNRKLSHILKIIVPITAASLLLVICFSIWIIFHRKSIVENENQADSSPKIGHRFITYQDILRATECFSEANLVGSGSSSKVYKGTLSDGTVTAIKVFKMQYEWTQKNFDAECEVMRNARHRNLVKVISSCSTSDFNAVMMEYMPNGSLDKWLYSHNNFLNLAQRLDILIHIALALEYLHHDCTMPIIHCDLKPSNVLLDEDMNAHVADFGIAKLLAQDQAVVQTTTLGTIGYIAPEYGLDGHVSTSGDVYSFGILLLETLTRRRPTDDKFRGDFSLHQWVTNSYPDELMTVLDPNLLTDIGIGDGTVEQNDENRACIKQWVLSTIDVALLCLKESPEERINMRDVVVLLKEKKQELEQIKAKKLEQ